MWPVKCQYVNENEIVVSLSTVWSVYHVYKLKKKDFVEILCEVCLLAAFTSLLTF